MEKKGSRSVQSSSKGVATESKKNLDVSSGKPWPRNGRRREPTGGSLSAKNETSRKPTPQRTKAMDKRPRPRGNYYGNAIGGKEAAGLAECDAELGSVFVQGSKKQSLNHLLNFHYVTRESYWNSGRTVTKSGQHRWLSTQKHKYNKEQFLQANCQFVVTSSGEYKQYMNNPDALVDWDLIEQVNVQVSEYPSCPICLYPPMAAKMTRCGHIYCWSCILHYLALSDKTWRKCPICYEAVHKQDLKSVVAVTHPGLNVNDQITFQLMKRPRGSLLAYPSDYPIPDEDVLFSMSQVENTNLYSKLLLASKSDVLSILGREDAELKMQLAEDENCPEKCFIEQAVALLRDREACVLNKLVNSGSNALAMETLKEEDLVDVADSTLEEAASDMTENDESEELLPEISLEDLDISHGGQQPSKYFYFYQAADGQHIYLHALNVRMLERTYGSLENSPKTVVGKIIEKEGGSMTEDLRKRLRYLQHLPVTCQFEVAEIQLKEPVVTKETLEEFKDQIETRRKRRLRRAREEKRREKRITEEENRKMGKYPAANIHLESPQQFPDFSYEPVVGHQRTESESTPRSLSPTILESVAGSDVSSVAGSLGNDGEASGMSFAKMLSSSKPRSGAWPELKAPSAVEPVKLINVTGAKTASVFRSIRNRSESESSELEGYVPVPAFNQSFGDAIALAFEKASQSNDVEEGGEQGSSKKKKKKKPKQKLLFSTNMPYLG